jgi:hypothetical protein
MSKTTTENTHIEPAIKTSNEPPADATDKIRAYRVREVGHDKGGFIDPNPVNVGGFIETYISESEVGKGYVVTVEEVSQQWLENLPEFDGF